MKILYIILFALFCQSCDEIRGNKQPLAVGEKGEIAVFIPESSRTQGIEEVITQSVVQRLEGLLGSERNFDIKFVESSNMDDVIDRNVLEINIDPTNREEVFVKQTALKARDQYHMIVYAKDIPSAKTVIESRADKIVEGFNKRENADLTRIIHQKSNPNVQKAINKAQGVNIKVPSEFREFVYNQKEMAFLRGWETKTGAAGKLLIQKYLFVFNYGIGDFNTELKPSTAVVKINAMLKAFTTYDNNNEDKKAFLQITPDDIFPVVTKIVRQDNKRTLELRGNFTARTEDGESAQYGGYFVARAIRDLENGRIVVVFGAVNAPRDFAYREYIRQMQQIIATAKVN